MRKPAVQTNRAEQLQGSHLIDSVAHTETPPGTPNEDSFLNLRDIQCRWT